MSTTDVRPKVRAVPPPPEAAICGFYEGADLADAYAVRLPGPCPHDIRQVAEAALRDPAPWLRAAMRVRDTIVARFGVKTSAQIQQNLEQRRADRIGFFPVVSRLRPLKKAPTSPTPSSCRHARARYRFGVKTSRQILQSLGRTASASSPSCRLGSDNMFPPWSLWISERNGNKLLAASVESTDSPAKVGDMRFARHL